MKTDWSGWYKQLTEHPEDIRAETVVADLIMDGLVDLDDMFFIPNGGFHRMVSKDIAMIHEPGRYQIDTERAVFELNRKGLYDGLPEAMFHQNRKHRPFKSISEIKEEIMFHNATEQKARKFFAPLDNEICLTKCLVELNERRMTTELLEVGKGKGLKKFWNIPDLFNEKEQGALILLLPVVYRLTRDLALIAQAFEVILDVPVAIERAEPLVIAEGYSDGVSLGSGQLGVDMVAMGAFQDEDDRLKITLGPMDRESAASFAYMGTGHRKFTYLAELLLPADMELDLEVVVQPNERDLELHDANDFVRLGVTTFLT